LMVEINLITRAIEIKALSESVMRRKK